ncbi:DUF1330 domain-containing protein [Mesorhizobium sp. CA13]|uniref:DUF1330 domain-containing protein n=1 Tax=unclassified Mesorhizobium TaxID=325217 RepID=UPI00398C57D6
MSCKGRAFEGCGRPGRDRKFPDYDTALACYESLEYRKAIALRKDASINDIIVVEGVLSDPLQ